MRKHLIKITGITLKKGKRMSPITEKNTTKILCSIISGFHFRIPDIVDDLEVKLEDRKQEGGLQDVLDKIFEVKENTDGHKEDEGLASDSEEDQEPEQAEEDVQKKIDTYLKAQQEEIDVEDNKEAIQKTLTKSILPSLFKHLKDREKEGDSFDDAKVRIHVAVAITRILRKTTNRTFNQMFQKLIINIVG